MSLELNAGIDIINVLKESRSKPDVTGLNFRKVAFDQDVISALVSLFTASAERKWQHIGFYSCSGFDEMVITFIMTLENVEHLTFFDITDNSSKVLGTTLRFNKSLRRLTIRGLLSAENFSSYFGDGLGRNKGIKELDFQCCSFTREPVRILSKGLSTNRFVRILSLSECRLQDEHIAILGKALAKNSTLEELDLGYNRCCSEGLDALALALMFKDTNLTKLSLEHQDIGSSVFDMSTFAEALGHNKSLKYLDLSGNHLDNGDMERLSKALPKNSTLETLHLWNNDVSDPGVVSFAAQLPKMFGLKKLYLGDNPFGKDGTRQMLQALDSNDEIQYLGFPHFSWVREMAI